MPSLPTPEAKIDTVNFRLQVPQLYSREDHWPVNNKKIHPVIRPPTPTPNPARPETRPLLACFWKEVEFLRLFEA